MEFLLQEAILPWLKQEALFQWLLLALAFLKDVVFSSCNSNNYQALKIRSSSFYSYDSAKLLEPDSLYVLVLLPIRYLRLVQAHFKRNCLPIRPSRYGFVRKSSAFWSNRAGLIIYSFCYYHPLGAFLASMVGLPLVYPSLLLVCENTVWSLTN